VIIDKLLELGAPRLQLMDEAGIDVAVISLTSPGIERFEPAQSVKLAVRRTMPWPKPSPLILIATAATPPCPSPMSMPRSRNWSAR